MDSDFEYDEMVYNYDEERSSSSSLYTIPDEDIDHCMAFDYVDPARNTGLIAATRRGDVDSVRRLIGLGRELNNNDNTGNTALHIAAATKNVEIVQLLLEQPSIRIDVRDYAGQTPLHLCNNSAVAAALLTAGCDVNALDGKLYTPLHGIMAIDLSPPEKLEYARLLLSHGADVNTRSISGDTPLSDLVSVFGDDPETLELLCMLVCHGADVNKPSNDGPFINLLLQRRFGAAALVAAALVAGYVHDFTGIAEALHELEDVLEVYRFAGEFFDDYTSFTMLSRTVADPAVFATCWSIRPCGTYCVPLLESLVRNPPISPDVFYTIVDCDDFDSSLREHRPDVLHHIIRADMSQIDREKLVCTALTFQDSVAAADLNCVLERHGLGELFEAFMRANVEVEGPIAVASPISWVFHERPFGRATTLLEICRNAVRKCLRVGAGNFSFYSAVRRLDVPPHLKDYIVLKGQF